MFGYESTETGAIGRLKKSLNAVTAPGDYEKVYRLINKTGIHVMGLFMLGGPGETKEDLNSTFRIADRICDIIAYQPYEVIYGTPNHQEAENLEINDFYKHYFLHMPPSNPPRWAVLRKKILTYIDEFSALAKYAPDSYPSQLVKYKARNMYDIFKPPSLDDLRFSKILWDPNSSKKERMKRLQALTISCAREIGQRCRDQENTQ